VKNGQNFYLSIAYENHASHNLKILRGERLSASSLQGVASTTKKTGPLARLSRDNLCVPKPHFMLDG